MNSHDRLIQAALGAVVALGLAASVPAQTPKGDFEKCAGITKAGKNDCGTSVSSCAGTAKVDRDPEAWVLVPKGLCEKIAGGKVQTSPHAKPGGKG